MNKFNTPISIKKVFHKAQNRWMIRYYFGSTRFTDDDGNVKYKSYKKDEYPRIGWIKEPKNAYERQVNKNAEKELDKIISAKNTDLMRGKLGMLTEESKKANMLDDLQVYIDRKYTRPNTIKAHKSVLNKLKKFIGGDYISYKNIDEIFCRSFLEELETQEYSRGKLNKNSSMSYFNYFKVFLSEMHQKGKLLHYPAEKVIAKGTEHKVKDILTPDELQKLIKTDIRAHRSLKPYFIFACLTGQAHEECRLMTWNMIEQEGEKFYLRTQRRKTKKYFRISINYQAMKVLGERPADGNQKVFPTLKYSATQNDILQEWVNKAGIDKKVTPHVAKHTFASMFYKKNKDVGGLMHLLNHKDISTTQRYLAKLLGDDYFDDKEVTLDSFEF